MPDWDPRELSALAPEVNLAEARTRLLHARQARRRRRRLTNRAVAAIGVVAAAVGVTAVINSAAEIQLITAGPDNADTDESGNSSEGATARELAAQAGWVEVPSLDGALSVLLPPRWDVADQSLTPHLGWPREVLTVSTAELPVGDSRCAQYPAAALEAVGPTDSLITIQSLGHYPDSENFPPRGESLRETGATRSVVQECVPDGQWDAWWISFSDQGQQFYALVAIGEDATTEQRDETWRLLDTLVVNT